MNNVFNPYQFIQPVYQQQTQQLIRVSGMEGAKAYQLGPNSAVSLFHETEDVFYIKTTDGAGFPTIHAYKFEPLDEPVQKVEQYVTLEEFQAFKNEILKKEKSNGK